MVASQEALESGEEIAECPSCSLIVRVIYDPVSWARGSHCNDITHSVIIQEDFQPQKAAQSSKLLKLSS